MKVHLVRHAKAEKRLGWDAPDALRPLSPVGLLQSRALAQDLAAKGIRRIISSPHLRCTQTLDPLAATSGLSVEIDERLAEGADPEKALDLLTEVGSDPVALCSHGDLIPSFLFELEDRGVPLEIDGRFRCQKASVWLLEGERGHVRSARYQPAPYAEDPEEGDPERIAVLDLGSTSFRLVVFDATRAGRLQPLVSKRIMLRLGAAIALDGRISDEACAEAVKTARRLGEAAKEAGASRLLPVGTAAMRDAENGAELAALVGEALGTDVRIISGEEEARLLFLAFRRRVLLPHDPAIGIDLGGGSLELVMGDRGGIHWEATLPVGVTRLHRELVRRDPMRKREIRRVGERLVEALAASRVSLAGSSSRTCIAAGGTARAFARIALARRGARPNAVDGPVDLPVGELVSITRQLVRANHDARLEIPGVRRNRADLLPTGGILLTQLAETLGIESYTVCDWGLREGVVLEALAKS